MTGQFQNRTEEFTYRLCRETFLSLWSYANPRKAPNRGELCDVLVLCDPDIILVSVKDIQFNEEIEPAVAYQRWVKRAIKKSTKQLYGAMRWLDSSHRVIRSDGTDGLPLPELENRRVHCVSVSLGGRRRVPVLLQGNFGKGFVHVFDEVSFPLLIRHLDTVTDFVDYLRAKEGLVARCPPLEILGREENLLALYLHRGRQFPEGCPEDAIPDSYWDDVAAKPDFQRKLAEDLKDSYIWDGFIEHFAGHSLDGTLEFSNGIDNDELAYRVMARENRFARRVLGGAFREFYERAKAGQLEARMLKSPQEVGYVFVNVPPSVDRDTRRRILEMRCFVARGDLNCAQIVGLCINIEAAEKGHCEDLVHFYRPNWTADDEKVAQQLKDELGFFREPLMNEQYLEEYPPA